MKELTIIHDNGIPGQVGASAYNAIQASASSKQLLSIKEAYNMEHLQATYTAAYVALYDGMDELPSYPATVARFEYFTANSAAFRRARFRLEELQGDHIISDREAAAFVLAAEQCGII